MAGSGDPVSTSCQLTRTEEMVQAPPANHNFVLSQFDLTASLFYLLTSLALVWQPEEQLNRFIASHLLLIKAKWLLRKWGFKWNWYFSLISLSFPFCVSNYRKILLYFYRRNLIIHLRPIRRHLDLSIYMLMFFFNKHQDFTVPFYFITIIFR